jgi:hypothetical protein
VKIKDLFLSYPERANELYGDVLRLFKIKPHQPDSIPLHSFNAHHHDMATPELIPKSLHPDAVLFQSFITSAALRSPHRVAGIIADMRSLGVKMSKQNWASVINTLALDGQEDLVMNLLDILERDSALNISNSVVSEPKDAMMVSGPRPLPTVDAVTYVAALQGFLVRPHVHAADKVLKRLYRRRLKMDDETRDVMAYLQHKLEDAKMFHRSGNPPS